MPSNYKRLGDFIKEINVRNTNLKIDKLIGVSIEKKFISSVANIIGTDMSVYKIINKNQLACKLMSVGRDEKLPVDLYLSEEPAIISSAYYVFESKNYEILLPEYLKMWLFRSETDRYVGYISGGDVRGGISWDTFCEMPIIIPSPEKQQEIVREYNTIQNRIGLNNELINKLEETAQTIYRQWFVDFEFPNEDRKPYKSNGGIMVLCEELEKEVPEGWEFKRLDDYINIANGYAFTSSDFTIEKEIPVIKISNINDFKVNLEDTQYSKLSKHLVKYKVQYGDILITLTGSHKTQINSAVGKVAMYNYKCDSYLNQRVSKINSGFQSIIYQLVKTEYFRDYLMNGATGSANQANISPGLIKDYKVLYPTDILLIKLDKVFSILRSNILKTTEENQKLEELKYLLLAKMTRVESEKETNYNKN